MQVSCNFNQTYPGFSLKMTLKKIRTVLRTALTRIFVSLITFLCILIFLPALGMLLTPIFIYRIILFRLGPLLKPQLGKMLTARSTMYASEDFGSFGTPKNNISTLIKIRGEPDIEGWIKHCEDTIVYSRDESGELLRPEIQQFVTSFGGFLFWQWDPNFNIRRHFHVLDSSHHYLNDRDLLDLQREELETPFDPRKPPWKVIIVKNYRPEGQKGSQYAVLLCLNHCLADGFSIFKIFLALTTRADPGDVEDVHKKMMDQFEGTFSLSWNPFSYVRGLYQFLENVVTSYDINSWHSPINPMTRKIRIAEGNPISITLLKDIRNSLQVGLTSVILGGITGGIRDFMARKGVKIPRNIHAAVPLPVPGHPEKLRNHITCCLIRLPVGIRDPKTRVSQIEESLRKMKASQIPVGFYCTWMCMGSLPWPIVKLLARNEVTTMVFSDFPGPGKLLMLGQEVFDVEFGSGLLSGRTGIIMAVVSYDGAIKITTQVDATIVGTDQGAREMLNCIQNEFQTLRNISIT